MKKRIVYWLKKQLKDSGAKGIVLGLSGGIDSSVVAALCKEAAGPKKLLGLILPINSHREDLKDAQIIAQKFGINVKTIDLSGIYSQLLKILPGADKLAKANLKPRLRMSVFYYFANKLNYLVCGTGNKAELAVGYFTKYGDGAVDLLPIGDLSKGEVRQLARELKIPEHIITKPPTAGLWFGQTDESEMGITYLELDNILVRIEQKKPQQAKKENVFKVRKMIERSEHKRQGPKICYV